MEYVELGNSGIKVSKLCFGGLTVGPLQADMPVQEGAAVIAEAFARGVNFIDTAELYGTYAHIREASRLGNMQPVISTKSYAYSGEQAEKSLEKARKELDRDMIDIFMLHEQESRLTLKGHREALEYYIDARERGTVRAVGVSTHNVEVVEACAEMPEIDVVHPIINSMGLGIGDGSLDEMLDAVKRCYDAGKGIFAMKPLAGGNLYAKVVESLRFVLDIPYVHSVAVGMQSIGEVLMNICIFEDREVPDSVRKRMGSGKRRLHIDFWCEGCGKCAERCSMNAIEIIGGKASVDREKCILCCYCAGVCPVFAIKTV